MNKFTSAASAIALAVLGTPALAEEIRMLISFPETLIFTQEIGIPFAKLIEEESGGELTVSITYPDAIPPFEQFEPVQAGAFDMLFTHPAYHAGVTTFGVAIDGSTADPALRRESGFLDYVDEYYQGLGLKVVGIPPMGSKPFRFYLKDPVTTTPAFEGLKIRGTAPYHPVIEYLGGVGVVISNGETYSAVQKGVVEGVANAAPAALGLKLNEVLGYMVEQPWGSASLLYMMNIDSWDGLSEEGKAAITRAAIRMENEAIAKMDAHAADEKAQLIELGMKMTHVSDEEAAQLDAVWSEGVWALGSKSAPEATAALREIAREAGLSN